MINTWFIHRERSATISCNVYRWQIQDRVPVVRAVSSHDEEQRVRLSIIRKIAGRSRRRQVICRARVPLSRALGEAQQTPLRGRAASVGARAPGCALGSRRIKAVASRSRQEFLTAADPISSALRMRPPEASLLVLAINAGRWSTTNWPILSISRSDVGASAGVKSCFSTRIHKRGNTWGVRFRDVGGCPAPLTKSRSWV